MDRVRVVVCGVGAMGSLMVRLLEDRPAVVVGAVDRDPDKAGRDLGEVAGLGRRTGVIVAPNDAGVLDRVECDVVLLATTAFAAEAEPQILEAVRRRRHVVSIVQELFFPVGAAVECAARIDDAAREAGVAVTAVGINPGFIMDVLPAVCSYPCWHVDSIEVRRHVDFSPYGPDEMVHIGAGLTEAEFRAGVAAGTIGHIGLLETAAMVNHCLGMGVEELRQTKEPLIAERERTTAFVAVPKGRVYGFRQNVVGSRAGKTVLDFRMVAVLDPRPGDGLELGDHFRINGTPNVDVTVKEEISQKGGLGTSGVAVNTIPLVLGASPGFHTIDRLALPHRWRSSAAPPVVRVGR